MYILYIKQPFNTLNSRTISYSNSLHGNNIKAMPIFVRDIRICHITLGYVT